MFRFLLYVQRSFNKSFLNITIQVCVLIKKKKKMGYYGSSPGYQNGDPYFTGDPYGIYSPYSYSHIQGFNPNQQQDPYGIYSSYSYPYTQGFNNQQQIQEKIYNGILEMSIPVQDLKNETIDSRLKEDNISESKSLHNPNGQYPYGNNPHTYHKQTHKKKYTQQKSVSPSQLYIPYPVAYPVPVSITSNIPTQQMNPHTGIRPMVPNRISRQINPNPSPPPIVPHCPSVCHPNPSPPPIVPHCSSVCHPTRRVVRRYGRTCSPTRNVCSTICSPQPVRGSCIPRNQFCKPRSSVRRCSPIRFQPNRRTINTGISGISACATGPVRGSQYTSVSHTNRALLQGGSPRPDQIPVPHYHLRRKRSTATAPIIIADDSSSDDNVAYLENQNQMNNLILQSVLSEKVEKDIEDTTLLNGSMYPPLDGML